MGKKKKRTRRKTNTKPRNSPLRRGTFFDQAPRKTTTPSFTFSPPKTFLANFEGKAPKKKRRGVPTARRPSTILDRPTNPRKATRLLDNFTGGEQNARNTFSHFQGKGRTSFLDNFSPRGPTMPMQRSGMPQQGISRALASGTISLARKGAQAVAGKIIERRQTQPTQPREEIIIPETAGTELSPEEIIALQGEEQKPVGIIGGAIDRFKRTQERRRMEKEARQALQTYEGET